MKFMGMSKQSSVASAQKSSNNFSSPKRVNNQMLKIAKGGSATVQLVEDSEGSDMENNKSKRQKQRASSIKKASQFMHMEQLSMHETNNTK